VAKLLKRRALADAIGGFMKMVCPVCPGVDENSPRDFAIAGRSDLRRWESKGALRNWPEAR
jgi:hypothetical protein